MLRITRDDHPNHILITIEGRLAGDDVGIAESACDEALSTRIPVTVFLNRVMDIDSQGRAFLAQLLMRHVRLRAAGIYSRYVVRTLDRRRNRPA